MLRTALVAASALATAQAWTVNASAAASQPAPVEASGDYVAQNFMPVFTVMTGNAARMQAAAPDRAAATKLYARR